MVTAGRLLKVGVAATYLLVGTTTNSYSQGSSGQGAFGGEMRGMTLIKGKVVCVDCSLEELRGSQSESRNLYQVSYETGRLVMEVTEVSEPQRWSALVSTPHLWARAKASVLQQLTAEENLFQELEVTGLLRDTRTLDIHEVKVRKRKAPIAEE